MSSSGAATCNLVRWVYLFTVLSHAKEVQMVLAPYGEVLVTDTHTVAGLQTAGQLTGIGGEK